MGSSTYPVGVKIYIDDKDVTKVIFGTDIIELTALNNKRRNIDITSYVKTPGTHKIKVVPESGVGRVETRLEIR